MPKWSSEQEARREIRRLVASYYHEYIEDHSQFQPGDRIAYAGRVFDEEEMCGLSDALLDFWLTTGRFTERFEKEFGEYLGIQYAKTCDELLEQAEIVAIATAWPEFADVRDRTDAPVVDCRYML